MRTRLPVPRELFLKTQFVITRGAKVISMHRSLVILTLLLGSSTTFANDLVGQASIIDGDTLEIHGVRIRLWGIDAPESSQLCRGADSNLYRCGANAANDLDTFIARRPVSCTPVSEDQYGRSVAICSVGGVDLGEWLVRNGLALDWPQLFEGEVQLRRARRGSFGARDVGGQLRGAMLVSRVHQGRRHPDQLFG